MHKYTQVLLQCLLIFLKLASKNITLVVHVIIYSSIQNSLLDLLKLFLQVYTVNQESCHILVFNIPSLGITKDLLELFSLHGEIEEYMTNCYDNKVTLIIKGTDYWMNIPVKSLLMYAILNIKI